MTGKDNHPALEAIAARYGRETTDVLELFLERRAIREVDGGQPRDIAEVGAIRDVEDWFQHGGVHAH